MKYSDIVAVVLDKLNLTSSEAQYDNILTKIPRFCNEALGDIANRGKPYYKTLIINISSTTIDPDSLMPNEIASTSRYITFPSDFLSLTNEFIQRVPITVTDGVVEETDEYDRIDGSKFRRLNSRQLLFPNDMEYRYLVPTLCRYPSITGSETADIDIEPSVLDLLPNYVVSEILRVDDVGLSSVYRNLYESSLAALNDTVLDPAGSIHNEAW